MDVSCPYCSKPASTARGADVGLGFPHAHKPIWRCEPCRAWVAANPDGKPGGRLATLPVREARAAAMRALENALDLDRAGYPIQEMNPARLQIASNIMRRRVQAWLADELDLPFAEARVGMMTGVEMLQEVARIAATADARVIRFKYLEPGVPLRAAPRSVQGPASA